MIEVVTLYVNLNTQNKIYFSHNIVCLCFIIINLKVIVKSFRNFLENCRWKLSKINSTKYHLYSI